MQIRPTAFTIGLIIYFSIALFCVYTEFGIDSSKMVIMPLSVTLRGITICCQLLILSPFSAVFVKCRIAGIEVLCIKIVLSETESFAKANKIYTDLHVPNDFNMVFKHLYFVY